MDPKTLDRSEPFIKRGDIVRFQAQGEPVRRVIVTLVDIETNGRPVFEGMSLADPERGHFHWGYFGQVLDVNRTALPMIVSFRANGTVVDRVRVIADNDDHAIDLAREIVLARSVANPGLIPNLDDAAVGVDAMALEWLS